MKKFLVSLIIGITLMAIGTTMLVFEIKDFKIVDDRGEYMSKDTYKSHTFNVSKNDLIITFKNVSGTSYEWKYDDTMKDEVKVELFGNTDYKIYDKDNKLTIFNRGYHKDSDMDGFDYFNRFIDGLKQKKIYNYTTSSDIVITSSYKNQDHVKIDYE